MAETKVTKNEIAAQEAWIAPTLTNSWTNYDAAVYQSAGYMKDTMGFVHLKGLVMGGTSVVAIFTLPAGYRPAKTSMHAVIGSNAVARVDVTAGGVVSLNSGANGYLSLDGITFLAV